MDPAKLFQELRLDLISIALTHRLYRPGPVQFTDEWEPRLKELVEAFTYLDESNRPEFRVYLKAIFSIRCSKENHSHSILKIGAK